MREVINVVDTAYITIKDKTTDTIILEPYSVNVKILYLRLTNYSIKKMEESLILTKVVQFK